MTYEKEEEKLKFRMEGSKNPLIHTLDMLDSTSETLVWKVEGWDETWRVVWTRETREQPTGLVIDVDATLTANASSNVQETRDLLLKHIQRVNFQTLQKQCEFEYYSGRLMRYHTRDMIVNPNTAGIESTDDNTDDHVILPDIVYLTGHRVIENALKRIEDNDQQELGNVPLISALEAEARRDDRIEDNDQDFASAMHVNDQQDQELANVLLISALEAEASAMHVDDQQDQELSNVLYQQNAARVC